MTASTRYLPASCPWPPSTKTTSDTEHGRTGNIPAGREPGTRTGAAGGEREREKGGDRPGGLSYGAGGDGLEPAAVRRHARPRLPGRLADQSHSGSHRLCGRGTAHPGADRGLPATDRKSVVEGKRVDLGG